MWPWNKRSWDKGCDHEIKRSWDEGCDHKMKRSWDEWFNHEIKYHEMKDVIMK